MPTIIDVKNKPLGNKTCNPLLDNRPQLGNIYVASIKRTYIPKLRLNIKDEDVFEFDYLKIREDLKSFAQRVGSNITSLWELWKNDSIILKVDLWLYTDDKNKCFFPYATVKENGVDYLSVSEISVEKEILLKRSIDELKKNKTYKQPEIKKIESEISKEKIKYDNVAKEENAIRNQITYIKNFGYTTEYLENISSSKTNISSLEQHQVEVLERQISHLITKRKVSEDKLQELVKTRDFEIEKIYSDDYDKRQLALKASIFDPDKFGFKHAVRIKNENFDVRKKSLCELTLNRLNFISYNQKVYVVAETKGLENEKIIVNFKQAKEKALGELESNITFVVDNSAKSDFEIKISDFIPPKANKSMETISETDSSTFRGVTINYQHEIEYLDKVNSNSNNDFKKSALEVQLYSQNENEQKQWLAYLNEKSTFFKLCAVKDKSCEKEVIYKGVKNKSEDKYNNYWANNEEEWLEFIDVPKHLKIAIGEIGQEEIIGKNNNHRISIDYFGSVGKKGSSDDNVPWCSAFMNWCIEQAGLAGTKSALALSWRAWENGEVVKEPYLGSLVTIKHSNGKGHVGLVTGKKGNRIAVLGGNQGKPGGKKGEGLIVNNTWNTINNKTMVFVHPHGVARIPPPEIPVAPLSSDATFEITSANSR